METNLKFKLTELTHDLIAPITSIRGLVNLTQYVKSKEDAQDICIRLQQCSQRIDKRMTEALSNISGGKLQL